MQPRRLHHVPSFFVGRLVMRGRAAADAYLDTLESDVITDLEQALQTEAGLRQIDPGLG